ncbi:hypothetical protein J4T99_gp111 [Mycobacterium phage Bromden]|uniref:Uncharacterized protein n=1 Tax=Mycobacterium phage Bromden TaxID=2283252 RepID=A0A345MBQ0_9CAUD|nr:hypothetical protein J4T99_gp111 [Mycobacterium phage Bromden]AXH67921.1 hypothetical protein SEA_BROMDEN_130 [Mycobacterium phage Bromden]
MTAHPYVLADGLATLKELFGIPHNGTEYADHSDPDAIPTADDIVEMHAWAERAKADESFSRFMRRAHGLLDRAYMSSKVGYAQSAIATAQRAMSDADVHNRPRQVDRGL